jgi:hypothetical protein
MFGSEEDRLRELPQLIRAVIDGRFEWRYVRSTWRVLLWCVRGLWKLEGTFHTEDGPWRFARYGVGVGPPRQGAAGTYESYRRGSTR